MTTLIVSNFRTGYETDLDPVLINNDAFPILNNAYVWRGRIKKKPGTFRLGRLRRALTSANTGLLTDGAGARAGNIITALSLNAAASFVIGSITITIGAQTFTDPTGRGILVGSTGGTGTFIYATGAFTIAGAAAATAIFITLAYYPNLPVLGFEDFYQGLLNFPTTVDFDTTYSYQFNQSTNLFYNVTFYKTTTTPFIWHNQNYQQFWSTNYSGAMWVTANNAFFHFEPISVLTPGGVTTITTAAAHGLITNDWVFFNEITGADAGLLNGLSFQITVTGATTFTVAVVTAALNNSGIFQTLTNDSNRASTNDGIRWYDGDPTVDPTKGWVNFAPPLSQFNATTNPLPQYLIGARLIVPFKNRLLFYGCWLATSVSPGGIYQPNMLIYSQNGTPYYSNPAPSNQTVDPTAFHQVTFKGGFIRSPFPEEFITAEEINDIIVVGTEDRKIKTIFTADDSLPFIFQTINSEFGDQSTFGFITLFNSVLGISDFGWVTCSPENAIRFDDIIPDQVYDISQQDNGPERITAIRDYRNEFAYFTYKPSATDDVNLFNSRTLMYNYRDKTFATFDENYTHYGYFRFTSNRTWATLPYATWSQWNDPWNFGSTSSKYPFIAAGNQQGFVMLRENDSYNEDESQYISAIGSSNQITSPNHCLNNSDYVKFSGIIGDATMEIINEFVYPVTVISTDVFSIPVSTAFTGTYIGGGEYARLTNIFILSKQFAVYWGQARQTRISVQRVLLDKTPMGQVTWNMFCSMNSDFNVNNRSINNYLINTSILPTSPETNQPFQTTQDKIWHRTGNSFIGDTVQFGFTLSDAQMKTPGIYDAAITIQAVAIDLLPGPILI